MIRYSKRYNNKGGTTMEYIYTTTVAVPEETIRTICTNLKRNTMHGMLGMDIHLDDEQLYLMEKKMDAVIDSMCDSSRITVDGWHLTDANVLEIASFLRDCQKIAAIKAFRSFTGAGLREAKEFIDKFCTFQSNKQSCPLASMKFRVAFGR
jgi:hypothetical protein